VVLAIPASALTPTVALVVTNSVSTGNNPGMALIVLRACCSCVAQLPVSGKMIMPLRLHRLARLVVLLLAIAHPTTSEGSPLYIRLDPNQPDLLEAYGTFDAPLDGGYISSFSVTIQGITFDKPYDSTDNNAPTYRADIMAIGSPFPYDPSTPALIAHAAPFDGIVLNLFYDRIYNLNFTNSGIDLGYNDRGTYTISPEPFSVPVPEPSTLLLVVVGLLGAKRRAQRLHRLP
jgi:hypothetical protein